jgi:hypothetical protein
MSEPTVQLDQSQIDTFHEQGFLRLDRITSEAEVEELLDVYERLFLSDTHQEDRKQLGEINEEGEETLPQILSPHELAPELLETQYYTNATGIAEQLLGDGIEFQWITQSGSRPRVALKPHGIKTRRTGTPQCDTIGLRSGCRCKKPP